MESTPNADADDRVWQQFFDASMRTLNVLATHKRVLPAYVVALARALGDTLVEDIKPEHHGDAVNAFAQAAEKQIKRRGAELQIGQALQGLIELLQAAVPTEPDESPPKAH